MLQDRYKAELDGVTASEAFKTRTKALLQAERRAQNGGPNEETQSGPARRKKPLRFPAKPLAAAACAVLVVGGSFAALRATGMLGGYGAGAPAAAASTPAASVPEDAAPFAGAMETTPEAGGTGRGADGGNAETALNDVPALPVPRAADAQDAGYRVVLKSLDERPTHSWPAESWQAEVGAAPQPVRLVRAAPGPEELDAQVQEVAAAFGVVPQSTTAGTDAQGNPTASAIGQGVVILATSEGASVAFSPPRGSAPTAADETGQGRMAYLRALVPGLDALCEELETPVVDLVRSYTATGAPRWQYALYEGAGTPGEQLLARAEALCFTVAETGLAQAVLPRQGKAESLSGYPTVGPEQAEGMLRETLRATQAAGHAPYTGVLGTAMPHAEAPIAAVDITYDVPGVQGMLLPYYAFYLPLPQARGNATLPDGLTEYAVWYLPAVEQAYLEPA